MRPVYRIGATPEAISVERWSGWPAFETSIGRAAPSPSDLAYAREDVPADVWQAIGDGTIALERIRVRAGQIVAGTEILAADRELWTRSGATVLGYFQVVHGDDLPACLLLLRWPSLAAAFEGLTVFESDRDGIERRRIARDAAGGSVIRGSHRLLRSRLIFDLLD